jgi:heme-degrading monooxygenase HmoA
MYTRVTSVKAGPDGIDKATAAFEQNVVPGLRSQRGYQGAVLILYREAGEATGITMWDSLEALNASEAFNMELRRQVTASGAARILDVDRYETVIQEIIGEPKTPHYVRSNELYIQPDKIEALIGFMRDRVQAITSQKGCNALVMNVNRMTGHCVLNSAWATAEDREASETAVSGVRKEAGELAGSQPTVRVGEVPFAELRQPVKPT